MPLVRIDLQRGTATDYRATVGQVVYDSLLSIGVPQDDRFQIITEKSPQELLFDRSFLGINRSDALIIIQITLNEGRTTETKKKLYKAIADGLQARLACRPQDIFISLVEVKPENWSFGNGEAQYAR
jgi:4-oxalocrotonate tautomerase